MKIPALFVQNGKTHNILLDFVGFDCGQAICYTCDYRNYFFSNSLKN